MIPRDRSRRRRVTLAGRALAVAAGALLVAGCGTISRTPPAPTPADFCDDAGLAKTAIGFDASGLDQATPVRVRVFIFRNRETYERLRATIDQCAAGFVTDPETFESVETSPFVVAGQGPWGSTFKDTLRAAIVEAAGTSK